MNFWNKLINTGVYPGLSPADERKVRLLNGILLIGELLFILLIIKSIATNKPEEWSVQLLGALLFPVPIVLNHFRKYGLAKVLCLLIPFFYLSFLSIYWGSERGSQLILFACSGLAVLFFEDKRVIYGMIALGAICLIAVEIYNFNNEPYYRTEQLKVAYIINIIITVIMLAVISTIFRRESDKYQTRIQDKNKLLTQQHEQLIQLNTKLEESLTLIKWQTAYAQTIQNSILPLEKDLKEAFDEHFVLLKPRDVVSGDFHFFSRRNGKIFLAAVDCTGHGVPGAFMSLIGYNLLLEAIELHEIHSPNKILNYLEDRIHYALKQNHTQSKDGMDIALCVLDKAAQKLTFAGAKNPLMVVRESKGVELIKGDHYSIGGIHEDLEKQFTETEIDLSDVVAFYLYSDGFQDQFGGVRNKKYMSTRFRELLHTIHEDEMNKQQTHLEEELKSWMNGQEQTDDILIVGVKP